ncbi:MAG: tetratricopeptide repeat protein [Fidelibacterota bacterium]
MRLRSYTIGCSVLALGVFFWGCASEQLTSARLYLREENWDKAEEMLLAAMEVQPDNPEIYFHLGKEIYGRRGDWDKMNDMFDKAVSLGVGKKLPTGDSVKEAVQNARRSFWSDYYNKGADTYNRAVQSSGEERSEYLDTAIQAFETAKKIMPEEPKTYRNLVFSYLHSGQSELLQSTLDEALAKNPKDADLLVTAAKVFKDRGDYDQAVEFLEKAIRIAPGNSMALRFLAEIYYDQGDKEGAIFAYKKAIREDPENVDLYFNLGVLYLQIGDYDFAEDQFQKVLTLNPDDKEAAMGIGEAYERMEQWEDAEYYYGKALRVDSQNPTLLRALARVIYRQGRMEEAEDYLERAKATGPN